MMKLDIHFPRVYAHVPNGYTVQQLGCNSWNCIKEEIRYFFYHLDPYFLPWWSLDVYFYVATCSNVAYTKRHCCTRHYEIKRKTLHHFYFYSSIWEKLSQKNNEIKCSLYVYSALQCLDAPFDPSSGFIARDQQATMNLPKSYFSVSHKQQ
jgi:hypothetical protein